MVGVAFICCKVILPNMFYSFIYKIVTSLIEHVKKGNKHTEEYRTISAVTSSCIRPG